MIRQNTHAHSHVSLVHPFPLHRYSAPTHGSHQTYTAPDMPLFFKAAGLDDEASLGTTKERAMFVLSALLFGRGVAETALLTVRAFLYPFFFACFCCLPSILHLSFLDFSCYKRPRIFLKHAGIYRAFYKKKITASYHFCEHTLITSRWLDTQQSTSMIASETILCSSGPSLPQIQRNFK